MYDRIASTRPEGAMGNSKAVNHSTGRLVSIRQHFVPEANQWAVIGTGMLVELVSATNIQLPCCEGSSSPIVEFIVVVTRV